jgi:hypothetical protein
MSVMDDATREMVQVVPDGIQLKASIREQVVYRHIQVVGVIVDSRSIADLQVVHPSPRSTSSVKPLATMFELAQTVLGKINQSEYHQTVATLSWRDSTYIASAISGMAGRPRADHPFIRYTPLLTT